MWSLEAFPQILKVRVSWPFTIASHSARKPQMNWGRRVSQNAGLLARVLCCSSLREPFWYIVMVSLSGGWDLNTGGLPKVGGKWNSRAHLFGCQKKRGLESIHTRGSSEWPLKMCIMGEKKKQTMQGFPKPCAQMLTCLLNSSSWTIWISFQALIRKFCNMSLNSTSC